MTPISRTNRYFEFWYDDSGEYAQHGDGDWGGFYGPGVVLERKVDNDTMLDYDDILRNWDGRFDLYE